MKKKFRGLHPTILDLLSIKGAMTHKEIVKKLGLGEKGAYMTLGNAMRVRMVDVDKSTRPCTYFLTESAKKYRKKHGSFVEAKLRQNLMDNEYLKKLVTIVKEWEREHD